MRISDWSSDVCSSDLLKHALAKHAIEEENAIYPALRDAGQRDGAEELIREHGDVKHYLYDLENIDRKSVVLGKSVSVRVDLGGRRIIKKKKSNSHMR